MNAMLQGTTPKLTFDFTNAGITVGDLDAAELTVTSKAVKITKTLSQMTVDTANNKLSYTFTEGETLQLSDTADAWYQLYVKVDAEIYGTKKTPVNIFQKIKGEAMA